MTNRLSRYREAVQQLPARGVSSRGWITISRDAAGNLTTQIRAGLLATHGTDEVAEEIRSALVAALADFHGRYRATRREFFGDELGVGEFSDPGRPA